MPLPKPNLEAPPLCRTQQALPPLPKPRAPVVWPGNRDQSPEANKADSPISPPLPPPKESASEELAEAVEDGRRRAQQDDRVEEAPRGRRAKRWGAE